MADKLDKLTAKQTAFVEALLSGMTQIDAYRAAYDVSGMSDNAQHVEASKLCQNPKISLRLAEAAKASAGYRPLAACALDGTAIPAELRRFQPTLYYPSTLHLLSLAYVAERHPECLS